MIPIRLFKFFVSYFVFCPSTHIMIFFCMCDFANSFLVFETLVTNTFSFLLTPAVFVVVFVVVFHISRLSLYAVLFSLILRFFIEQSEFCAVALSLLIILFLFSTFFLLCFVSTSSITSSFFHYACFFMMRHHLYHPTSSSDVSFLTLLSTIFCVHFSPVSHLILIGYVISPLSTALTSIAIVMFNPVSTATTKWEICVDLPMIFLTQVLTTLTEASNKKQYLPYRHRQWSYPLHLSSLPLLTPPLPNLLRRCRRGFVHLCGNSHHLCWQVDCLFFFASMG